jgi:uncharacterized membrane protein YphA (DoxX/SURF4 family)
MLGVTFIVAAVNKIGDSGKFATIIYGYYLFPGWIINLSAIVLPFVELVAGVALVAGVYPRSALMIVNTLLFVFIGAIMINLVRGHQFDCGCFSLAASDTVESAVWLLVRDLGLLICGAYLWFKSSPVA